MNIDINKAIPSFPWIIIEINRLMDSRDATYEMMASIIEKDPAICLKVLKIVNSAFYGMSSSISNIPDAVSILGFDAVHRISLTISAFKTIGNVSVSSNFNEWNLWKHLFMTASISRYISMQFKISSSCDAYIAGLLHDMGKLILYSLVPSYYAKIQQISRDRGIPFYRVEEKLGKNPTHSELGAFAAKKWNFPKRLIRAIRYHHSTDLSGEQSREDIELLILSNTIETYKFLILNNDESWKKYLTDSVLENMHKIIDSVRYWLPGVIEEAEKEFNLFAGVLR